MLAGEGYLVLAISLRGRGESQAGTAGADSLHVDVLAAVRYLRALGSESVAAVGASLGGWAVAEAVVEAEPDEIDRVVLLAHSPILGPEQLRGRKLFVISREDTRGGGVRRLAELMDQYERAPEPKKLLILEGGAHAQLLFQTDQRERLLREILQFLAAP
jgi:dienelactone hydrolase